MPVLRIPVGARVNEDAFLSELRRQLLVEWSGGQTEEPRPEIHEEQDPAGRTVHIYVIWDAWEDVDDNKRAELVMDAFVELYGREAVLNVTIAMGLTSDEANRMGLAG